MSNSFEPVALRVLSLCMGVFLVFMGLDKISWFTDGGEFLAGRLYEWRETARPVVQWYLETVCIPGIAIFARLVPIGELATGAALLLGARVRLAAAVALLMVLNFHFASDILFRYSYLINGYGPPILGALLALVIGGGRLPMSVDRLQANRRR